MSLIVLVLVGVGIVASVELSGNGYLLAGQQARVKEGAEAQEPRKYQAKAKASFVKAEKLFWKSELMRKADENLESITLKSIFSKEKDKRKSQGRRTGDGQHSDAYYRFMWYVKTPLIYASVVIVIASVIFANSVLPKPEYITTEKIVKVIEYTEPKTAEQIQAIQNELIKRTGKADRRKADAEPTQTVELY